ALEQFAVRGDLDLGAAEFAVVTAFDLAAELLRHRLLAVADAEHRHAGLIDRHRGERRAFFVHRRRPTGEDDGLGLQLAAGGLGLLVGHEPAIGPLLARAPRDELRPLRAEVDDQDFVVHTDPAGRTRTRRESTAVRSRYVAVALRQVKAAMPPCAWRKVRAPARQSRRRLTPINAVSARLPPAEPSTSRAVPQAAHSSTAYRPPSPPPT